MYRVNTMEHYMEKFQVVEEALRRVVKSVVLPGIESPL